MRFQFYSSKELKQMLMQKLFFSFVVIFLVVSLPNHINVTVYNDFTKAAIVLVNFGSTGKSGLV
jgi:hypothetical protein